jgi:hypothetical protein
MKVQPRLKNIKFSNFLYFRLSINGKGVVEMHKNRMPT